jgi:IS5 family transposase
VACGLALDHEGFNYTVFTYWRTRLRQSERPQRISDAVREVIDATGVLAGRRRRALDSTILDDAVASQDTVTQLISAVRRVRRLVPEAAQVELAGHDYDSAAKPVIAWDDPVAKQALITALVNDALALVHALEGLALDGEAADAVGLLALVAGQDVEPGEESGTWRIARRVAPERTISTVDPEARHTRKSPSRPRDGYKAHLAIEPETGLVTDATLTGANVADAEVAPELLEDEEEGVEVLGDSAYGSGRLRAELDRAGHSATIKPVPSRPAVPGGWSRRLRGRSRGQHRHLPGGGHGDVRPRLKASFGSHCASCPFRSRCTTSPRGRTVSLNLYDIELEAARRQAETEEFQRSYRRWRPMVERTIAWLVAAGNRRLRYRGVARNHQWLVTRTAALNLRRLVNLGLVHDGGWVLAAG